MSSKPPSTSGPTFAGVARSVASPAPGSTVAAAEHAQAPDRPPSSSEPAEQRQPGAGPFAPHRAVLDAVALARLAELDPTGENQLLSRVMKTFQSSAVRLTVQLELARRSGDRPTIRLVAHTLKSSSGYIGAKQLVTRCAELESASRSPTPIDLNALLDAMIAELELTLDAIARRLPAP